jgi:hypothetical protein
VKLCLQDSEIQEKKEALVPDQKTAVNFRLQDVVHTLKKAIKSRSRSAVRGSRLFAVNPQKFMDNPNFASKEDYTKHLLKYTMTVLLRLTS